MTEAPPTVPGAGTVLVVRGGRPERHEEPGIVLELEHDIRSQPLTPNDPPAGQPVPHGRWVTTSREIGLPANLEEAQKFRDRHTAIGDIAARFVARIATAVLAEFRLDGISRLYESKLALPARVARPLKARLAQFLTENEPLWLDIRKPTRYLPLIPWEQVLGRHLSCPIVRLSRHPLQPVSSDDELQVVVWATGVSHGGLVTAKQLWRLLDQIRTSLPNNSTVHVFTDDQMYGGLVKLSVPVQLPRAASVRMYDPTSAPSVEHDREEFDPQRPWTSWVRQVLGGRGVDIVHVVTRGRLLVDCAGLLIARDPVPLTSDNEQGRATRIIPSPAVHDVLTELGAWAFVATMPPDHMSRLAMRVIADRVARDRPGPALLHDLGLDAESRDLHAAYARLFGRTGKLVRSDAITIYGKPAQLGLAPETGEDAVTALLPAYREACERAKQVIRQPGPTPSWVAAGQRYLEEVAAETVARGAESEIDRAAADGVNAAIQFMSRVLTDPPAAAPEASRSERQP